MKFKNFSLTEVERRLITTRGGKGNGETLVRGYRLSERSKFYGFIEQCIIVVYD